MANLVAPQIVDISYEMSDDIFLSVNEIVSALNA